MITNKPYWAQKEQRAAEAKEWYEKMKDIPLSENIFYGGPDRKPALTGKTGDFTPVVNGLDTVSAAFNIPKGENGCILNFASFKNPGGAWLNGSMAQEESLCSESNLYHNLAAQEKGFYEWNRTHLNRAMYQDRAIYTKDAVFIHDGIERHFDVLTCAAPNFGAASKYQNVSREENTRVLRQRIRFIRAIMEENGVTYAILGAYGCGVFRQDAEEVAQLFKEVMKDAPFVCEYAVLNTVHRENYDAFKKVFR